MLYHGESHADIINLDSQITIQRLLQPMEVMNTPQIWHACSKEQYKIETQPVRVNHWHVQIHSWSYKVGSPSSALHLE